MLIAGLLFGTYKIMGASLSVIAAIFILYYLFGDKIPGYFQHGGFSLLSLVDVEYMTTEGIFGTALSASATFVVMFIIFGAFLDYSGVGDYFISFATSLTAKSTAGPAKSAVIASLLFGTISGSVIANVATTGQVTIPLMKKNGYPKYYAGAVEAVASTGGVIMPPVMGAAAFVMSEFTGIPYVQIMKHAFLPALLYYLSIFFMIHFDALKMNIKPLDDIPILTKKDAIRKSYFFLPIIVLVIVLVLGYSPTKAVLFCTLFTVIISQLDKDTRMGPKKILDALISGGKGTISVGMVCATAGIIVGVVSFTGLGNKISGSLVALAQNNLFIALIMTAVSSIVLGMGLPTTPSYIIVSTLIAPSLVKMGLPLIGAHMFCFYFANISNITPPVALAAYTAAGLSGSNPMKTGYSAFRLGIAAYIVPFMFAYNPLLLLVGAETLVLIQVMITSIIGIFMLAVAAVGHFKLSIPIWQRIALFASAIMLIDPGSLTDFIGFTIGVAILVLNHIKSKRVQQII
jgi:TRAP transporter 4TM/12TM fusion protein